MLEIQKEDVKTVEDVKRLFADTIFWNWMGSVDEGLSDPNHDDAEYPLRLRDTPQNQDGYREFILTFESGEASVQVATMPNWARGDAESTITEPDAVFIAALPMAIPILLREIKSLQEAHSLLVEVYRQAGNSAPAERRHSLTPGLRDRIREHIWIDCPTCNGSGKTLRQPVPVEVA